ncbi:hypothetical protein [Brevundimonas sp.]|uniref:hypothetical protein n=1 Tax=Brevundimonas sp. TaxID=1871086 RepID=UPI0025C4F410|nr:hypothetical protein [Brevundimonas sp.]
MRIAISVVLALCLVAAVFTRDTHPDFMARRPPLPVAATDPWGNLTTAQADQSQAASARVMVDLTALQIILTILGTGGLFVSLWYTRRSLAQTAAALDHARTVSAQELRAYIELKYTKPSLRQTKRVLEFSLKNHGQTPARAVQIAYRYVVLDECPWEFDFGDRIPFAFFPLREIPPGGEGTCWLPLGPPAEADTHMIPDRTMVLWLKLKFLDAFGEPQWVDYSICLTGPEFEFVYINPPHTFSS